jgi:general secretion pathway protein F
MSHGQTLPQALEAEGPQFPGIYRAVVEAGMKAGRLPTALESLAGFARSYMDLRRAIGLALLYPLLVLILAYSLFVFFVLQVAPRFVEAFESLGIPVHGSIRLLAWLGEEAVYWVPVLPVVLLLAAFGWYQSGRSAMLQPGKGRWLVRWFPWMRSVLAATEAANFADLLALLTDHGVPFSTGIVLAAEASGDPALMKGGQEIAAALERGDSLADSMSRPTSFPPLLRWVMITGQRQGTLVSALRHAAETYRRRALNRAEMIRVFLPIILMALIGVTATLIFALALFLPVASMLSELSMPAR